MEEKARCISAATLLHESMRRKLQEYLRPMANDDDRVWQQMTFENFVRLIDNKRLYYKAYGEYSDYDEIKLREFVKAHLKEAHLGEDFKGEIEETLRDMYDKFERKIFISCWYNSPDLSDVVFKIYARGNSGIAVGTRVSALRAQMYNAQERYNNGHADNKIRNIICANVQYLPQRYIQEEELFEPAQVYAPVFMKGLQFKMDNEFRVCLEKEKSEEYRYNSAQNLENARGMLSKYAEEIKDLDRTDLVKHIDRIEKDYEEYDRKLRKNCDPTRTFLPVSLPGLIESIAIKDDSWFHVLGEEKIISLFDKWFKIKMHLSNKYRNSGFLVFDVETIGGEKVCLK